MGQLLSYSILGGLLMLALFPVYRLVLSGENMHGYNRGVLLGIYGVSFGAFPAMALFGAMWPQQVGSGVAAIELEAVQSAVTPDQAPVWGTVLLWIFLAGMAVVLVRTVVTWSRIMLMIRGGHKTRSDVYTLVIVDNTRMAPFSWMNYAVMSRATINSDEAAAVLAHEREHIVRHHWIDLIVAQCVCILNWFNPAAWLMRDELMLVHEYQADMAVVVQGFDMRQYQMMLIKKAVGSRFPSLANSLNHSKLKKRITMMYDQKKGAGRKFKTLALVPMVALALGVSGMPAVKSAIATIEGSDISLREVSENISPVQDQNPAAPAQVPAQVPEGSNEALACYPGGEVALYNAIMEKLEFPDPERQWSENASGRAVIRFTITPQGTMDDFSVIRSSGYSDLDACAVEAIRSGLTERWTPAYSNGQPVATSYVIPVQFRQK